MNRVQQLNINEQSENGSSSNVFVKASLLEPLSEKELQFLTDSVKDNSTEPEPEPEPENRVPIIDVIKAKNKADYADCHADCHNGQLLKPLIHKETRASTEKTASNIIWLAIGLVCGLLLSVAIIVILNKTGVLPTLTHSLQTNQVLKESRVEDKKKNEVAMGEERQAQVDAQDKSKLPSEKITPLPSTPVSSQQEATQQHITPDSNISIDDFREEAQSTLYRDVKD